jgi:predicted kinase
MDEQKSADLPESPPAFEELKPLLIIVAGPPCSGKTLLGRRIAQEFRFPFVNKDDIKESLFNRLGWKDDDWSRLLSLASFDLLYYFVAAQIAVGRSLVVEGNFKTEVDTEKFLALKEHFDFEPLQVQCQAQGEVLAQRFRERIGQRHPGHVDHEIYERLEPVLLKGRHEPLNIGGQLIEVDTTDLQTIDYNRIFDVIRAALAGT